MPAPVVSALFTKLWPVVAAAAAGLVGYGVLTTKVTVLQESARIQATDHDKLTTVDTAQQGMKEQLTRIELKVDRLLDRRSNPDRDQGHR